MAAKISNKISEIELIKLAKKIGPSYYPSLGNKLGFGQAELENFLISSQQDMREAIHTILRRWNNNRPMSENSREVLGRILDDTELKATGDLLKYGLLVTVPFSEHQLKEKVTCNRSRIMVVGPAGVGKTSFIKRLTNQSFQEEEKSTVGTVNTHTTSQWKVETIPRDELAESLARRKSTSSGEREFSSQGAQDEASVNQTSAYESYGNEKLKEYAKGISPERIHNVTSSANDIIYSIWDFGGQEIYYITHPLFLSWRSLYIAVFPLHKLMTENALREEGQMEGGPTKAYRTMLDLMHFWMMSIYIHAVPPHHMKVRGDPKILLVGTFSNDDKSKSNKHTSISKLQNMITDKPYASQVISSVVEVDNKSSSHDEISMIQGQIDDLITGADYMKEELPIKWRIFLDKTKDLRQDTLKLTEAHKIMGEIGIHGEEVQDVLRFCHDAGHLIYHQGCKLIILHPEVLNSFVSKIITVVIREKLHGELGEHWKRLQKKGVLSMDLIKEVWKQHEGKDDELDMVIDMMIKFDLMCEIQDTQGAYQGRHFFVPCRSSPTLHLEEQHGSDDEFQFIIDFKHLLPDGFLHRLYVRMAKWAMDQGGPEDPSFHCREMLFYIDERHRVIMSNDIEGGNAHKLKVTIYAISAGDHPDPNAKVNFQCPFMKYLDDTLEELKETWARRITYAVGIECPKCHNTVRLAKFRRYKERAPCWNCCSSLLVSKVPQCIRRNIAAAVNLDSITSDTAVLSYTPIPGAVLYTITYTDGVTTNTQQATDTTATITGLTPGTNYQFSVTSTSFSGQRDLGSVTGTTDVETNVNVDSVTTTTSTLSWTPINGKCIYQIFYTGPDGQEQQANLSINPTTTITGLTPGATYTFRVQANSAAGLRPVGTATASTGSVDAKTTGSAGLLGDARRRTVESAQRSVDLPHQPSKRSASASSHGQQAFYDIYLVYNEDTEHVRNVKAIIHRNGWTMTTPYDSRLGVPKMDSIEEALKTCSHVVLVITEEDCRKNDPDQTMTINMAFHSSEKSFGSRVIPIRCCDEKHLPQKLKSLTNACVIDANLEDRLKKSINVSIRKRREGTSAGSDDSSQSSASSN